MRPAASEFHLRFVDAAVEVAVEHHHLVTSAEHPAQAQDETVGVGGRGGHLPIGRPKRRASSAPTHRLSSVGSIRVEPRRAWRAMASATAGWAWRTWSPIAEGEVDVLLAVDVGDARARASFTSSGQLPGHCCIQCNGAPYSQWRRFSR